MGHQAQNQVVSMNPLIVKIRKMDEIFEEINSIWFGLGLVGDIIFCKPIFICRIEMHKIVLLSVVVMVGDHCRTTD